MVKKICFIFLVAAFFTACSKKENTPEQGAPDKKAQTEPSIDVPSLSASLTFHASFDNGPDADYGKGDRAIYYGNFNKYTEEGLPDIQRGPGNPELPIVPGAGKYGAAIEFLQESDQVTGYKLKDNIAFAENNWSGSISFWMRLNTNDIPVKYCDPIQLTDKDYASDAIWIDITKNDMPPDLRLGFFGDQPTWDKNNLKGKAEEFFFRLMKVWEPPFSREKWTYVVITWEKINTEDIGRARLYINGEYAGPSGPITEPFNWNMDKATFRLGTGKYVGFFDDIAIFSKSLTLDEISYIYNLKKGIKELY